MIFTRSRSGLANMARFHRVDCVVFIEGGTKSIGYNDVLEGQAGDEADDILYWRTVFSGLRPCLRITFKPVGSKSVLLKLAADIQAGVQNICVAMDSDFDRFNDKTIKAPRVLYTWGYSWENDLYSPHTILETAISLSPIDRFTYEPKIKADIDSAISTIVKDLRWAVRSDMLLSMHRKSAFDRSKMQGNFRKISGRFGLRIDKKKIRKRIKNLHSMRCKGPSSGIPEPWRDCWGHLLGHFAYRLCVSVWKKYTTIPEPPRKTFLAMAASVFQINLHNPSIAYLMSHHTRQFGSIPLRPDRNPDKN